MKIAILNDLHFGARNGQSHLEAETKKFFKEVFIPYTIENEIKEVIIAGDLFDDRKQINVKTFNMAAEFFQETENLNYRIIPGNHDLYYKNTIRPNSIEPFVANYPNVEFVGEPKVYEYDGYPIHLIPWICLENEEECLEAIESKKARTLITHTDIIGSQSVPGVFMEHGFSMETFYDYDYVLNGHIHTKSKIGGNIINLGTQYQMNWSDYGQKKGFHIFDTEKVELTFVPNPRDIYTKIFYTDNLIEGWDPIEWLLANSEHFEKKFIKVIVSGEVNRYILDKAMNILNTDVETYDIKVIEDVQGLFVDENLSSDLLSQTKSTIHIIHDVIDETPMDKNIKKDVLKALMSKFYSDALNRVAYSE